jgi:hypothetical protein
MDSDVRIILLLRRTWPQLRAERKVVEKNVLTFFKVLRYYRYDFPYNLGYSLKAIHC